MPVTVQDSMRQAFLADIRENPADDAPRLIYADWLEEQGECDRAELIRLQIQMMNRPINKDQRPAPQWWLDLKGRERQLLHSVPAFWMGVTPYTLPGNVRRGFVEQVTASMSWWLEYADALLAEHPVRSAAIHLDQSGVDRLRQFYPERCQSRGIIMATQITTLGMLRACWPEVKYWEERR